MEGNQEISMEDFNITIRSHCKQILLESKILIYLVSDETTATSEGVNGAASKVYQKIEAMNRFADSRKDIQNNNSKQFVLSSADALKSSIESLTSSCMDLLTNPFDFLTKQKLSNCCVTVATNLKTLIAASESLSTTSIPPPSSASNPIKSDGKNAKSDKENVTPSRNTSFLDVVAVPPQGSNQTAPPALPPASFLYSTRSFENKLYNINNNINNNNNPSDGNESLIGQSVDELIPEEEEKKAIADAKQAVEALTKLKESVYRSDEKSDEDFLNSIKKCSKCATDLLITVRSFKLHDVASMLKETTIGVISASKILYKTPGDELFQKQMEAATFKFAQAIRNSVHALKSLRQAALEEQTEEIVALSRSPSQNGSSNVEVYEEKSKPSGRPLSSFPNHMLRSALKAHENAESFVELNNLAVGSRRSIMKLSKEDLQLSFGKDEKKIEQKEEDPSKDLGEGNKENNASNEEENNSKKMSPALGITSSARSLLVPTTERANQKMKIEKRMSAKRKELEELSLTWQRNQVTKEAEKSNSAESSAQSSSTNSPLTSPQKAKEPTKDQPSNLTDSFKSPKKSEKTEKMLKAEKKAAKEAAKEAERKAKLEAKEKKKTLRGTKERSNSLLSPPTISFASSENSPSQASPPADLYSSMKERPTKRSKDVTPMLNSSYGSNLNLYLSPNANVEGNRLSTASIGSERPFKFETVEDSKEITNQVAKRILKLLRSSSSSSTLTPSSSNDGGNVANAGNLEKNASQNEKKEEEREEKSLEQMIQQEILNAVRELGDKFGEWNGEDDNSSFLSNDSSDFTVDIPVKPPSKIHFQKASQFVKTQKIKSELKLEEQKLCQDLLDISKDLRESALEALKTCYKSIEEPQSDIKDVTELIKKTIELVKSGTKICVEVSKLVGVSYAEQCLNASFSLLEKTGMRGKLLDHVVAAATTQSDNSIVAVTQFLRRRILMTSTQFRSMLSIFISSLVSLSNMIGVSSMRWKSSLIYIAATTHSLVLAKEDFMDLLETSRYIASSKSNQHEDAVAMEVAILNEDEDEEELPFWEEISMSNESSNALLSPRMKGINNSSSFDTLKSGTLNKLVESLTSDEVIDETFMKTFFTTYLSFTTADKLLDKLSERFKGPEGCNNQRRLQLIQQRTCVVLKHWIEHRFGDFGEKQIVKLHNFVDQISNYLSDIARSLKSQLLKKSGQRRDNLVDLLDPPEVYVFDMEGHSHSAFFMALNDIEIARQLTAVDSEIFQSIAPAELLNQAWNKEKIQFRSPNVSDLIIRANKISFWIATLILQHETIAERSKLIQKLIDIAEELRKLNNYNTLMGFIAGLNMSSILRLKKTFEDVPPAKLEVFKSLEKLMSPVGSYKLYRTNIKKAIPPLLPYIGTYLSDLTFIDEGNPDRTKEGFINFQKCELIYNSISEIESWQQWPYFFPKVEPIHTMVRNLPACSDKELYTLSLKHEPREHAVLKNEGSSDKLISAGNTIKFKTLGKKGFLQQEDKK
eukprot:TRINITY_DN1360_c0_g1_i1.p1 TRINITY_DN1360_c0_g1~~TRINITY_DN1360_c0_g1_i1.p1  ORF type:complete len:1498 (-),score=713.70 TRINITY_DN1360_c0_g1_i1:124-4617(-)